MMNPKSIAFHHFGCKVNYAEASALSRQFRELGFTIVDFHESADVYVISSCAVTRVAEKKCRAAIRQAHRINPEARIAVIGCFPELKPEELAAMEGVDIVLGHTGKFSLVEQITGHINTEAGSNDDHGAIYPGRPLPDSFVPSYSSGDRTRSFLKIQDGCDYFCSYCTIPLARGRSRSDTIENVVRNARDILAGGTREIVLTGVNIGDFGRRNGESFLELIRSLDGIKELARLRISSIEPDLLSDDIIDFVAGSERIMPHFHIPLQSGCDRTLRAMNRKYDTALYESRVTRIREKLPLACIAADVILGFPGETDVDFRETYEFLERLPVSYMHVFPYSRRENTRAANMADPVRDSVKKGRSEALHELSGRKKHRFYLENLGTEAEVLFESDNTNGYMHGFTGNYIKVKTTFNPELINRIVPVTLDNLAGSEFMVTFQALKTNG